MATLNCNTAHLTFEELLGALMTKTATGDWALRTTFVNACALEAVDCSKNALSTDQMLKKLIGVDPVCGKIAIRLANPSLTYLPFVDAAAAIAGGILVGQSYYNTTTNRITTRLV